MIDKKVLITGIDSFTGRHLSWYLQKNGYEVYGTSLFSSGEKLYQCDITNKDDIKTVLKKIVPNYLIHLSGISFAAHGKAEDFYSVNTIGTLNILDSLLELSLELEKVVIASSATVYGNLGLEVLDESLCPKPANHYGASKYSMECLVTNYFPKLPIILTRPFNYTGVGQSEHFLIPKIVSHYKKNKQFIELGNLDVSREFNDVEFVCEVYTKLLQIENSNEIVNICTSRGIKLLDVIDHMNKIANYDIEVRVNPEFVRKDEIKHLVGDCNKLFTLVGKVEQNEIQKTLKVMFES